MRPPDAPACTQYWGPLVCLERTSCWTIGWGPVTKKNCNYFQVVLRTCHLGWRLLTNLIFKATSRIPVFSLQFTSLLQREKSKNHLHWWILLIPLEIVVRKRRKTMDSSLCQGVRWKPSIIPFNSRWYGIVWVPLVPNNLSNSVQIADSYRTPRFDGSVNGEPKTQIHGNSGRGKASDHLKTLIHTAHLGSTQAWTVNQIRGPILSQKEGRRATTWNCWAPRPTSLPWSTKRSSMKAGELRLSRWDALSCKPCPNFSCVKVSYRMRWTSASPF